MLEVRIYDGNGKLKETLSREKVLARSDENFKNAQRTNTREMTFKDFTCDDCRVSFKSNSTRGARYCPKCRSGAYRRSKRKKAEAEKKKGNL